MPSLRETYSKKDKAPFGTYIAYKQLEALYSKNTIRDKKRDFIDTWNNITDTQALYVCISPLLMVNNSEVKAMLNYVYAGNDLFISSAYIDPLLLKKIGCKQTYYEVSEYDIFDSMRNTFTSPLNPPGSAYSYFYLPYRDYFYDIDHSNTRVTGWNAYGQPNAIVHFYGKGKLFLHCDPRAFSNYFLLKEDNYQYLQKALAYTGSFPEHVYWDDYYNKLRHRKSDDEDADKGGFSTFGTILGYPSLAFAFWISIALLLLYILFGGKRTQRIIDQRKSNENTTVTFTETIGRLYLQKKDNKNIADKMITYFNEYIRNKYFLNTNLINDDFITALSRKSGVTKDQVDSLFRTITNAHNSTELSDYELLSLNEQIQNFYKNRN